ncbi:DUF2085 domain-containing protein [candidate division KSB1 bacterium]|nr:DUF2085 domain-containing protein [candidate division KSB1 bacterium]
MKRLQENIRIQACFCHHEVVKGFSLFSVNRYLCSRCLGICLGSILAIFFYYLGIQVGLLAAFFLIMPLVIDGIFQTLRIYQSRNDIRMISGALFGLGLNVLGLIR